MKITDSQWNVMEVLWSSEVPLTVSWICRRLEEERGIRWNKNTVNTFLTRLAENGAVAHQETAPKTFYALIRREDCVRSEGKSFLNKMYHGSLKMMIASFLEDEELSREEIEEIRSMLEEEPHE